MGEPLRRRELAAGGIKLSAAAAGTRALLSAAFAATAALLGAAPGQAQSIGSSADATILAASYGLEARLDSIYAIASREAPFGTGVRSMLASFQSHAREHQGRLAEGIGGLAPLPKPENVRDLPGIAATPDTEAWLEIALGFESQAYIGYLDAVGLLRTQVAVELVTRLGASSAQHLALLREALGSNPIPSAFETGGRG